MKNIILLLFFTYPFCLIGQVRITIPNPLILNIGNTTYQDLIAQGSFDIVISEIDNGDFISILGDEDGDPMTPDTPVLQTFILQMPSDFELQPSTGNITVTGSGITLVVYSISSDQISISYRITNESAINQIRINGLRARVKTSVSTPSTGILKRLGGGSDNASQVGNSPADMRPHAIFSSLPPEPIYLVAREALVGLDNDNDPGTNEANINISPNEEITFTAVPNNAADYDFYINNTLQTNGGGVFISGNIMRYRPNNNDEVRVVITLGSIARSTNQIVVSVTNVSSPFEVALNNTYCTDQSTQILKIKEDILRIIANDSFYKIIGVRYGASGNYLTPVTVYNIPPNPLPFVVLDIFPSYNNTGSNYCFASAMQRINSNIPFNPLLPTGAYNPTIFSNAVTFNPCDGFIFDPAQAGVGAINISIIVEDVISGSPIQFTWAAQEVNVIAKPSPIIEGDFSFCSDDNTQVYSTLPNSSNNFNWQIIPASAGIIISNNNNQVTVSWTNNGTIQVTETSNSLGSCQGVNNQAITINPLPNPTINNDNLVVCAGSEDDSFLYSTPFVVGNLYTWEVTNGNFTSANNTNQVLVNWGNSTSGTIKVTEFNLSSACTNSDTRNVTISPLPEAKFSFYSACENNVLTVELDGTSSNVAFGTINTWNWEFEGGTGTLNPLNGDNSKIQYTFDTPGLKKAKMTVITNFNCENVLEKSFYLGNDGWFGSSEKGQFSWKFKTPDGDTIRSYQDKEVWITDVANADSTFYPNEQSFVESPCFDLSLFENPMISLNIWSDTDSNADGTVLLYKVEHPDSTWKLVFFLGGGLNWYDQKNLLGKPADETLNPNRFGWAGKYNQWQTSRFALDGVKSFAGFNPVRFRVGFGSNSDNPANQAFDGVAFDSVLVLERKRVVLVEHFTNSQDTRIATAQTYNSLNDIIDDVSNKKTVDIRYHVNFPVNENPAFNNPIWFKNDHSARALFYGVQDTPFTTLDGLVQPFTDVATYKDSIQLQLSRLILRDPLFDIDESLVSISGTNSLDISFNIKQNTVLVPQETLFNIEVCLVENIVSLNGIDYRNVVRRFIRDAAFSSPKTWNDLTDFTANFSWTPPNSSEWHKDIQANQFKVFIIVRGYQSKQIYQVAFKEIAVDIDFPAINQAPEENQGILTDDVVVFPNPNTGDFQIFLKNTPLQNKEWILYNSFGVVIASGSIQKNSNLTTIQQKLLPKGVYTLQIQNIQKKIVVR